MFSQCWIISWYELMFRSNFMKETCIRLSCCFFPRMTRKSTKTSPSEKGQHDMAVTYYKTVVTRWTVRKDIQDINRPVRAGYTQYRGKPCSQWCPAQCWWWLFWHQTVQPVPRSDSVPSRQTDQLWLMCACPHRGELRLNPDDICNNVTPLYSARTGAILHF